MHIVLTGGGTAGHVVPQLAIAEAIRARIKSAKITYIGSYEGMERELAMRASLKYEAISTGKLRRYFDLKNFYDTLRVPIGIVQAWFKLGRLKPDVVFSKGGYVGVPVVIAAWLRRIPVIIHESDSLPGLSTRLCAPFAKKILTGFKETGENLKKDKCEFVGNPVRPEMLEGKASRAKRITGFKGGKPVLLVMGGSLGAQEINEIIKVEKTRLTEIFDVIHITGKGKGRKRKEKHYFAVPYVHEDLKDFYALASLALSRAGASTLAELDALRLPALLYPLGLKASRGDQIANAASIAKRNQMFKIANPKKSAHSQLLLLPRRPENSHGNWATEKIVSIILGTK